MKSINLVDISRFHQKYGLLYSRIYKKNKSCSRIDQIYISRELCLNTGVFNSEICPTSDHLLITHQIKIKSDTFKKSRWKFNPNILYPRIEFIRNNEIQVLKSSKNPKRLVRI